MRPAVRAAVVLLALLVGACTTTTRLASSWVEPGRAPQVYRDLVVFGIAANENVRHAYEESFVAALKARGVKAIEGYKLLPGGGLGNGKTIGKAVALSGADAVIITHLVGTDTEQVQVTQSSHVTPSLHGSLFTYYDRVYGYVTEPGYYATFKVLQLETNLYDARRGTLVWSGRSQTMDPTSEQTTISEVIEAVTDALATAGFLPPGNT